MWSLAQTYNYTTTTSSSGGAGFLLFIYLVLIVVFVVALWKIFVKAGQEGWKSIIPIYNTVILCNIVGLSGWYVLLLLIPFVNIAFAVYLYYKLSQTFGHGWGMTLLIFLAGIGLLILGFGDSKYKKPVEVSTHTPAAA